MKKVKVFCVVLVLVIILSVVYVPVPVHAVDPVSSAALANALAQAITAYGAGHGVSMTFDVASTEGIGEGVHDLWNQFISDTGSNAPAYDSLAINIWSTLYKKVGDKLSINLDSTTVSYFDAFWNWVLSGPAEMVKVDNQYQWTYENGVVNPITVVTIPLYTPININSNFANLTNEQKYYASSPTISYLSSNQAGYEFTKASVSTSAIVYCFGYGASGICFLTQENNVTVYTTRMRYNTSTGALTYSDSGTHNLNTSHYGNSIHYYNTDSYANSSYGYNVDFFVPYFADLATGLSTYESYFTNPDDDSISVQPYVGDAVPGDVSIPDNEDVNYTPLPWIGGLDYSWDPTWGDGETISDAQGIAIQEALDGEIEDDGTLLLAGDDVVNPPSDNGGNVGNAGDYEVPGLEDIFPFCIPFDVYHFLEALAAEPQAPSFTAQLAFPTAVGGTRSITIDFDTPEWNSVAQILRTLELLLFIIGLAVVTREKFIRS